MSMDRERETCARDESKRQQRGAVPLPVVAAQTGEYRGLTVYPELPVGTRAVLVDGDRFEPHIRRGEWAVIDPADREPQSGELFGAIIHSPRTSSGKATVLVCLQSRHYRRGREVDGKVVWEEGVFWWRVYGLPHPAARDLALMDRIRLGYVRMSDGPLTADRLGIAGRVVGVIAGETA